MPNPRIAQELVVSLDTVKKHVSHLLGKLGAANAPRPSPGPAARPNPLTGRPRPGRHCRAMSRQGTFHR
jgi:DNA-binding NarL/FixJ family response regulator